jgi:DNA-binding NarL/FixJ family response regulator
MWRSNVVQNAQPLHYRVRVVIADSSPINSQLLAETLAKDDRIEVIGFGSGPEDIFSTTLKNHPDVLLISARLEEQATHGLDVLRQLRAELDALKAVVLIDSSKPDIVVEAFRSGACGIFCRNTPINFLYKCITAVHEGQIWANSKEMGFILRELAVSRSFLSNDCNGLLLLSRREREVVKCLADALTNHQIAERLNLSQHTVKNYMFRIFEKLGVSNRVELIFYVLNRQNQNGHGRQSSSPSDDSATLRL